VYSIMGDTPKSGPEIQEIKACTRGTWDGDPGGAGPGRGPRAGIWAGRHLARALMVSGSNISSN